MRRPPDTLAVRWLGRFCLERKDATLSDLRIAAEAFEGLPTDPEWAVGVLSELVDSRL